MDQRRHLLILLSGAASLHAVGCAQYYDESVAVDGQVDGAYLDPTHSTTDSMAEVLPTSSVPSAVGLPPSTAASVDGTTSSATPPIGPPPVGVENSFVPFEVTFAPEDMVREFAAEKGLAPCDDTLFTSDLDHVPGAEAPVLYVSADVAAAAPDDAAPIADGSREAPFATIGGALESAVAGTTVVVAAGTYDEGMRIPAGVLVVGGFDPTTWERTADKSVLTNGVYFQSTPASSVATEHADSAAFASLSDFDVRRGVFVEPGSRVVLRDNVIAVDALTQPSRSGVEAVDAVLRAEDNTLVYAVDPAPDHAFDTGFKQTGGCSLMARNQVRGFRTSFRVKDAVGTAIVHNVVEGSYNGLWLENSDPVVAANAFYCIPPPQGCVYAMYMRLDSNPKVRNNHFFLSSLNTRGINEECVACDPEELWGNAFHTRSPGSVLYIDRNAAELETTSLDSLTDVESVNGMSDIAVIGDNTTQVADVASP